MPGPSALDSGDGVEETLPWPWFLLSFSATWSLGRGACKTVLGVEVPSTRFLEIKCRWELPWGRAQNGWRGLLRDSEGKWVCGFTSHAMEGSSFIAQLLALRDGLRMAWDQGMRFLLYESDCMDLVKILVETSCIRYHMSKLGFFRRRGNFLTRDGEWNFLGLTGRAMPQRIGLRSGDASILRPT